jgi:hypothetical protein
MLTGPNYQQFVQAITQMMQGKAAMGGGGGGSKGGGQMTGNSPMTPSGGPNMGPQNNTTAAQANSSAANMQDPQAVINAAMTGNANTPLAQGMSQVQRAPNGYLMPNGGGNSGFMGTTGGPGAMGGTIPQQSLGQGGPFAQAGATQYGALAGGLSALSNGQLQALVNHYNLDLANPQQYANAMSPYNQQQYQSGQAGLAAQHLGAYDQNQAGTWLQQASWFNNPAGGQSDAMANLSKNLTPPPPNPNAPPGSSITNGFNYNQQQQNAWNQWGADQKAAMAQRDAQANPETGNPIISSSAFNAYNPGGGGGGINFTPSSGNDTAVLSAIRQSNGLGTGLEGQQQQQGQQQPAYGTVGGMSMGTPGQPDSGGDSGGGDGGGGDGGGGD